MILVAVGMQLGFDRLIAAMDRLAPALGMPVIAQTGKGTLVPQHMETRPTLSATEFEALVKQARVVVGHAGIGTILTASRQNKPIVIMPRQAALREHRNDHQLATIRGLAGRPGILIAQDETELAVRIEEALALGEWSPSQSPTVRDLHAALARFIADGPSQGRRGG